MAGQGRMVEAESETVRMLPANVATKKVEVANLRVRVDGFVSALHMIECEAESAGSLYCGICVGAVVEGESERMCTVRGCGVVCHRGEVGMRFPATVKGRQVTGARRGW